MKFRKDRWHQDGCSMDVRFAWWPVKVAPGVTVWLEKFYEVHSPWYWCPVRRDGVVDQTRTQDAGVAVAAYETYRKEQAERSETAPTPAGA